MDKEKLKEKLHENEDIALRFIELLEYKIERIAKHPYTGLLSGYQKYINY